MVLAVGLVLLILRSIAIMAPFQREKVGARLSAAPEASVLHTGKVKGLPAVQVHN